MTASLELCNQLVEKGCPREAEKWHYRVIVKGWDGKIEVGEWRIGTVEEIPSTITEVKTYPAYSTDELLEWLPDETEMTKRANQYAFTLGTTKVDTIPAEALGRLVLWLLDNSYVFKDGKLEGR